MLDHHRHPVRQGRNVEGLAPRRKRAGAAALDGLGILIQPTYIVHDDIVAGRLLPLLDDWDLPRLTINLAYPSRKHLSAKVRSFIDFMAEHFRAMGYERKWTARWAAEAAIRCERQQRRTFGPSECAGCPPSSLHSRRCLAMAFTFHMVPGAPDPVAPFSHAVETADGWVFVTGQMPFVGTSIDGPYPDGMTGPYPEGIEAQMRQVMRNLEAVLAGCSLVLADVVSVRIYLSAFEADYEAMNAVYAGYFAPGRRPARTCIGVTALARGARIEIDLVARR